MTQTAAGALTVLDLPDGERDLIGLARVSTDAQDARLQQDALALAGCGRVYVEEVSTRKSGTERPGLTAALDYLRRGDTLVVWKLDRLGRSRGPETVRPRNSSTDWSRRSMTSENNWFGEVLAARTSGNPGPDVPYGQLSASENRDPGLRRRRWS